MRQISTHCSRRTMCGVALLLLTLALAPVPGWAQRPAASPQLAETAPAAPQVLLRRAFPALTFTKPVHLAVIPDGSGDLAVVEQAGRILRISPRRPGEAADLLDIRDAVNDSGWEEGLLSVAFHPLFGTNGQVYVYYTALRPRRTVISRFAYDVQRRRAVKDSEEVLLEVEQPYSNHNGGQLAFGPDGMLYAGLGDGGWAGDPEGNGQDAATLLGAILRLNVDVPGERTLYSIPEDNPFADATDGSRAEIWAYGLRNPWRFAFDTLTGELYAGDVGQGNREEVDRIRRGGNYGWNRMEGTACYRARACDATGMELPIAEYTHEEGQSITGGVVYRGNAVPELAGLYLFADFASGRIWSIPAEAVPITPHTLLLESGLNISSFGLDAAGEVYVLDLNGGLYRLEAAQ